MIIYFVDNKNLENIIKHFSQIEIISIFRNELYGDGLI